MGRLKVFLGDKTLRASLVAQLVKNLFAMQETQVRKIPWRRKWQPTPVLLPGEFHEQRSLAGYSPWDHKKSDMTVRLTFTFTEVKEQGERVIGYMWAVLRLETQEEENVWEKDAEFLFWTCYILGTKG